MTAVDDAWRSSLRPVTFADLARSVDRDYGRDVMSVIARWLPREG